MQLRVAPRKLVVLGAGLALLAAAAAGNSLPVPAAARFPAGPRALPGVSPGNAGNPALPRASRSGPQAVAVGRSAGSPRTPAIAPLRRLLQADVFVVAPTTLRPGIAAAVRRLPGVAAVQQLDAARIQMDGKLTATLGVNASAFRAFAARPTAESLGLWRNVASGAVAVSYTMGKLDGLPLGRDVRVTGAKVEELPLAGFGTVGIGGVDAVVSDSVARSLGIPAGNAIVISAPHAELASLMRRIRKVLPRSAAIAPLVAQSSSDTVAAGAAGTAGVGAAGPGASDSPGLSRAEVIAFLAAAESRLGMPYVWGANGPNSFDCSGLVQWSLAQAGVAMPRVAADQALTGPQVLLSQLAPGDLLFYHTDPTAPDYVSHVAIYLGDGKMLQAPAPGMFVEVVPASFGSEFAGAVQVNPRLAAAAAANPAG